MKKIAFSLIFIMALSSNCGKEEGGSLRIEGTHLTIQELRDYVPISWQQEDKLVYKNEAGEEKTLHISYLDGVGERTHEGLVYTAESFEINIFDPTDLGFQLIVLGSSHFNTTGTAVNKTITALLMPFNENGTVTAKVSFINGEPSIQAFDDFREMVILHGKSFHDVYMNTTGNQFDEYSELDLNSEVGIVAFRDKENDLWVFDRVVE